jgi:hypothetical protein
MFKYCLVTVTAGEVRIGNRYFCVLTECVIELHTLKDDVRFEVFTAVTMRNAVVWDVTQCGSCKNRSLRRLLVTASVLPSTPILVTLIIEELSSSETLVLTGATRRNIPQDGIVHGHCRENLKSYIFHYVSVYR